MIKVEVDPGGCGFVTTINCTAENKKTILIEFATTCPNLKPLEAELKQADGYQESFGKVGETGVFQAFRKYCKHAACPVPTAVVKGIEAASGLALPRNVEMKITKE